MPFGVLVFTTEIHRLEWAPYEVDCDIVMAVCSSVALPISVKMTLYFSAIGHSAEILVQHGAAGLVLLID